MRRGLIAVFARHGLLANLLMIVIFALGGVALTRMNIQFFPTFALDVISVRVVWSGARWSRRSSGRAASVPRRKRSWTG